MVQEPYLCTQSSYNNLLFTVPIFQLPLRRTQYGDMDLYLWQNLLNLHFGNPMHEVLVDAGF